MINRLAVLSWIAFISIAFADEVGPSFECKPVMTPVEKVICSDSALSELDRRMDNAYRGRLSQADDIGKRALTETQRHWLRFRAPSCSLPVKGTIDEDRVRSALPCMASVYSDRIFILSQRCEVDESRSLEDMAGSAKPWSTKAPRGFRIEPVERMFTITWETFITTSYNLPSEKLPAARRASANLKAPYREIAHCRVIAPDGKRWLAGRSRDGNLDYVLESATTLEDGQ